MVQGIQAGAEGLLRHSSGKLLSKMKAYDTNMLSLQIHRINDAVGWEDLGDGTLALWPCPTSISSLSGRLRRR